MNKTLRISPELCRSASLEMSGEEGKRDFFMSLSSEEPYKRTDWDGEEYYEILDHSPGGLDDSRLKAGLPILFNHKSDCPLGNAKKFENDGKKIRVSEIVWSASQFAQEKKKDAESGALPFTSVGYRITDGGTQVGERNGVPILKFKWAIHEGSLAPVPADYTVGPMRSRADDKEAALIEISVSTKETVDTITKTTTTTLTPMADPIAPAADTKPTIDVSKERNEAVTAERSRVKSIADLSRHFAEKGLGGRKIDTAELAQKFIGEGKTEQEFRNAVMEGTFSEAREQKIETTPELGMSERDKKTFSLVRAMRCIANKQPLGGLEGEASAAHARLINKDPDGGAFYIPEDVMRGRAYPNGYNAEANGQVRALFAGTYSAAGALVADDLSAFSLIELLRNQMMVVKMGARSLAGLKGNVPIPRQTGGATASWLAEDSTISATNQTVGQLNLTPHKLAAATAYTQQLLTQSSIDVENFVRQDLMAVIAIARDLAALNGSGVSGQPLGIINNSNLSTNVTLASAESLTYAKAIAFETNVALNNAAQGRLGYLASIGARANAKQLAEIQSTNSNPVWKNDTVNGYPAFATNQMPTANGVLFGNWDDLILASWAETSVLVDPYSLSLQGQIRIVMQMMCDNGLRHTQSFAKGIL